MRVCVLCRESMCVREQERECVCVLCRESVLCRVCVCARERVREREPKGRLNTIHPNVSRTDRMNIKNIFSVFHPSNG